VNPSRLFITRPVATTLLMLAIFLAGALAYTQLPISALPMVDYPIIQVRTFYPGASPDVMATSVTAPLERQFGQMPGLAQMTSTSSSGSSIITLQFALSINLDVAEQEVQAAINAAFTFLPADLPVPPVYSKVNPADAPILTLGLTSASLPLPKIEDLADTRLAQRISQVPGVGLVSISGGQRPAVRINANPTSLSAYGLSLEDLRAAIVSGNVNRAKGAFDGPHRSYTIGANDQLLTSADYRALVIAFRNNGPVYLSDVAEAIDGSENQQQAAWMNSVPAIIVNVQRQPGANVIEVVDRIQHLLPQLRASLPDALDLTVLTDRTITIRASVHDVQIELGLAVVLVVLVIFVFLRNLPATTIPSIAVPLSLVGTFGLMYLLDFSLNNLSLMALTISTGFVVDDAIVMIENVDRFVEAGEPPLQAALKGAQQIGFTIVSLTVSLIAVLIPLLFMGGVVGRLFREFAVTLGVTIVFSAVVSLTLTPMMCARLLRKVSPERQGRFFRGSQRVFDAVIGFYGRTLRWTLNHQTGMVMTALGTLVATILLYIVVPKGFFPVQDTGLIQGITDAPQWVSFPAVAQRQQQVAALISRDPAIASLSSFIGIDGVNTTLNSGRLLINLKPLGQRGETATSVIARLQGSLHQLEDTRVYLQPVQDLTVDAQVTRAQYQYLLGSPDAAELDRSAKRLQEALAGQASLRRLSTDQQLRGLRLQLSLDRNTATRLGITPQLIDDTLYDAFGQRQVSTIFTELNQYRAVLAVAPQFQADPRWLHSIFLRSSSGGQIPLAAFTEQSEAVGPLSINRAGQLPSVTMSFDLAQGASLGEAVSATEKTVTTLRLPASVHGRFQGTAEAFQASVVNEPLLILAALVTVYIVLGILYESFIHPLTILSTLPSAGVGAVLALMLFRSDLGVIGVIGIVLLVGIVKKNGIMMVDFALDAERSEGKSPGDAIYQASLLRFRPIMMTTLAALLGALPLALGRGVGSELRRPLGITIVGGLLLSQLLTLYTTPSIYLALDRVALRLRRRKAEPE